MLLETMDSPGGDVIIYSQNITDPENNFKIIFKNDPQKRQRRIPFQDVSNYVNEYVSKNLIAYRLLTSVSSFEIENPKYGHTILINGYPELIFFDPLFAIMELEAFTDKLNLEDIRFRIQQVGLTTMSRKKNVANYAEVYSIDLEADEAKYQNDKVFVEAYFVHSKKIPAQKSKDKTLKQPGAKKLHYERLISLLPEDKSADRQQPVSESQPKAANMVRHNIIEVEGSVVTSFNLMHAGESPIVKEWKENSTVEAGSETGKTEEQIPKVPKGKSMIEIFKSPVSLKKLLDEREEKQHVLKLERKNL